MPKYGLGTNNHGVDLCDDAMQLCLQPRNEAEVCPPRRREDHWCLSHPSYLLISPPGCVCLASNTFLGASIFSAGRHLDDIFDYIQIGSFLCITLPPQTHLPLVRVADKRSSSTLVPRKNNQKCFLSALCDVAEVS